MNVETFLHNMNNLNWYFVFQNKVFFGIKQHDQLFQEKKYIFFSVF